MKRATPLIFSNSRAKRVCFDKDNGKVSSFKPDAVPENHFHLGGHNYAIISDFADVARIHLRRYKLDATGSLLPTKDGITVTPSVWLALIRQFAAIDQAFDDGKVIVIKDCLMLSLTVIENVTYIICQRYFQRKDFSRKFLTPVSMQKETEWKVLKDIQKQITSKTVSIMFGRVFLKLLRKEVAKHIPFPKSDYDCIDAEIVLTTSMVELLCNHIQENISSLFICYGCLEGYENQLGHECMTYSNEQRISNYGDLAILNMDWDKLVADFVNRNIQMVNYISEIFLNKLNMNVLIENAKQMYIATDSLLLFTSPLNPKYCKQMPRNNSQSLHFKNVNEKDVKYSKLFHRNKATESQWREREENTSASTPSEAVPGPSTTTETTLSNHGRTSVSSISTAPSRKRTVSSTFKSRNACLDTFEVYTFFPDTLTSKDLTVSLHSIKTEISDKISETASSKQGVKWYLNSCVHFIRKITTEDFESCTSYFRSKCCISLNQEIPDVETSIAKVIASCNEFENKGSGWEFQEVVKNKLKIAIYKPLAAASYIPLPPKLKNKKAILNIKNEDQRCFLWCVLAHLHPVEANANRVSTYLKFQNELCTKNLTFPTPLNQIECFEEKNKISINVFGFEKEIFPLKITTKDFDKHVNLLLISNQEKRHYCLIKNFNRLLSDLTQHKSESFYCNYCLHRFVKKSVLDAHIVDCRKHKEQKIKMPENKWLKFENFKFNLPVPYTIYADFESLIVKINSSTPDPERPFTVPIANHIPCGYAYVVIGPDGNFKNPPAVLSRRKCS
ncbi:uncharacterized protein TNCT_612361 [Trichonephila clavata]|uniref:C2H2-type domain-containing protein n=1 Tax=Trichonephila clavata TaxID=2740835 RepID=A0A8X6J9H6_TRICU|nr:uncharacterized protein TNCT_612361 [Trichonephila clavata]